MDEAGGEGSMMGAPEGGGKGSFFIEIGKSGRRSDEFVF